MVEEEEREEVEVEEEEGEEEDATTHLVDPALVEPATIAKGAVKPSSDVTVIVFGHALHMRLTLREKVAGVVRKAEGNSL